jgi:hypothetical protein
LKFRTESSSIVSALNIAGLVKPAFPKDTPGYLLTVSGDTCTVLSRDPKYVARSSFKITDVEGEGDVVFPESFVGAFKYHKDTLTFETTENKDGAPIVSFTSDSGATADKSTVNPKMITKCDDALNEAPVSHSFHSGVLQLGIQTVKEYVSTDDKAKPQFKIVQIFDDSKPEWEKGDGVMFASDSTRAVYFDCDAFRGKHLMLDGDHLSAVSSFLSKCGSEVTVRNGPKMAFFESPTGDLLGINHRVLAAHAKYMYYAFDKDRFSFKLDKDEILRALRQIRSLMDSSRDKIRMSYSNEAKQFTFQMQESTSKAQSTPVTVRHCEAAIEQDFKVNVNIDHFLSLFESVKNNEIEFRASIINREGKDSALLRTVDRFCVDSAGKVVSDRTQVGAISCTVTRFMPSKD